MMRCDVCQRPMKYHKLKGIIGGLMVFVLLEDQGFCRPTLIFKDVIISCKPTYMQSF